MRKRFSSHQVLYFFVFLSIVSLPLLAQDIARVAIIPFQSRGVAETEAQVITELFETALVKTGVYHIIEQNDIKAITEAQAYSLSGCVDDACAVEVGKLLSAELIVIGTLSKLGDQYIANAKFIDVAQGRNINADSVTAADIGEMTSEGITLLAYKLAGLTYAEGGAVQIASSFGELFVGTTPEGAEIYINGMLRGTSPLIVEKVPFGDIMVSARKGNMVGESTVSVNDSDLIEVDLTLRVALGRLFIKSSEKDVTVYLDGSELGPFGSGVFRDISTGSHRLMLKGDGLLYETEVVVEEGKTASVEAYPRSFGTVVAQFPIDASAHLTGRDTNLYIRSGVEVDLPLGEYTITFSGRNYDEFETIFTLRRGQIYTSEPQLSFNDEYLTAQAERKSAAAKEAEYLRLKNMIDSFGNLQIFADAVYMKMFQEDPKSVEKLDPMILVDMAHEMRIVAAEELFQILKASSQINVSFVYPDLEDSLKIITIDFLTERIENLSVMVELAEAKVESKKIIGFVSLGIGVAGFASSGIFYAMGQSEYETYDSALSTYQAGLSRSKLEEYSLFQYIGLGTGAGGGMLGAFMLGGNDNIPIWKAEIAECSMKLAELQDGF